jgi:hypothetical protein
MADENESTKDQGGGKPPQTEEEPYVNPLNRLTEEQWKDAMIKGIEDSKAQSASIRRDITIYYWKTRLPEVREELIKAESALRAYLERPPSEPPDIPRHRLLADDLKKVADDLRECIDKYIWMAFDDAVFRK